jgi:hypothetical protein
MVTLGMSLPLSLEDEEIGSVMDKMFRLCICTFGLSYRNNKEIAGEQLGTCNSEPRQTEVFINRDDCYLINQ